MLKQSLLPLAVAAFFASAGSAGAQAFPDGPGKEILEKKCSTCHAPEQVTTFGRSAEEWHEVVINMIDLGAEVNEEEAKTLVEYLAKNWPLKGAKPAEPAAGDKPAAPPGDTPAEEKPADKPAEEKPADKPADKPAENPEPKAAPGLTPPVPSHGPQARSIAVR